MKKPNILIFIPHDLGDYLGCCGHDDVKSPNLDKMASQGVRFTNFFTTAPECTSSRGSLFSGMYPHQNGLAGLSSFGWKMKVPHLASLLRDNGYETHLFGFQHESENPIKLGYEFAHSQSDMHARPVCESLIDFLKEKRTQKGPWLAHAGFKEAHRPWPQETSFSPEQIKLPSYLPDHPDIRKDYSFFYQNILHMDSQIGRVLDELEKSGQAENTIVIFTSDHGSPFPGAKATFYDPGIRIPLILYHKNKLPPGVMFEQLISNIDFLPTILEYTGCPAVENIEGHSFLPLLRGHQEKDYKEKNEVFGAMYYDVSYDPLFYVRTKTHKYIRSFAVDPKEAEGADSRVLAGFKGGRNVRFDDYDVLSSLTWKTIESDCPKPPKEELYDLKKDPDEQCNVASDPESERALERMRKLLASMMEKSGAPLPHSHLAPTAEQIEKGSAYRQKLGISTI